MPNSAGTIERIGLELAEALKPLQEVLGPELFDRLGVTLPYALASNSGIQNKFTAAANTVGDLQSKIGDLSSAVSSEDLVQIIAASAGVIASIAEMVARFKDAGQAIHAAAAGLPPADQSAVRDLAGEMATRVLEYVAVGYLDEKLPSLTAVTNLLGIIDKEHIPSMGLDVSNLPAELIPRRIRLDRVPKLLSDPVGFLGDAFGWTGNPVDMKAEVLLYKILALLESMNMPGVIYADPGQPLTLEAYLFSLQVDTSVSPPVLRFNFSLPGNLTYERTVPFSELWKGKTTVEADFEAGLGVEVAYPFTITAIPPHGNVDLTVTLGLVAEHDNGDPIDILSIAGGTRLQVQKIEGALGLRANLGSAGGELSPVVSVDLGGGKLIIDFSEGDGFIQQVLSGIKMEADFNLGADWDPKNGFRFRGDAGVELLLPLHIDLGVLVIDGLFVQIEVSDQIPLRLGLATRFAANLGPLKALVEKIGVNFDLTFPEGGAGGLGLADLGLGFRPPSGVGLSLDVGIVKGGGYLYFDFDRGEYAGVLELEIAELVSVKAIGLITTKMPDGSDGFSLLIIITAEFGTGIQLGYGFALVGLGGLAGLNRAMLPEPIAAGIRSGGINSIMFPPNPVENAPKIISDLRSFFPPAQGKFLIGPMAKIGWGTPALITLSLGVIIEIPGNVAIIGVLRLNLPTEEAAIVAINVGFIGALEFDKQRLWFYAELFDSRILFLTLEGGMGLLMDYGDNPNFVLSVGGFHPKFSPPPLPFPSPRRLRIDILNTSVARISVEAYFAVTSNTVQFGARADLYFGLAVVSVSGNFSFDALFQFSPFKFIIQLSFSVSLKVFGIGLFSIHLKLMLEGPTPWHAKGTGKLTIDLWLFEISVSASFDTTWGESRDTVLPSVEVVPLLKQEFGKDESWRAKLPAGSHLLVSLRALDEQTERLVLHPLGSLLIAQRAVPLNLDIDKVGNQAAADGKKFSVAVSSPGLGEREERPQDKFAIAQFQELSRDEKLTRPAFQKFDAGLELSVAGRQLGSAKAVRRTVRYETIIIDSNYKRFVIRFFAFVGTLFSHFLGGSAVKRSKLSRAYKKALVPMDLEDRIQVEEPKYVVASAVDNKPISENAVFANEALARDYLMGHIADHPGDADEVQVIHFFEAA